MGTHNARYLSISLSKKNKNLKAISVSNDSFSQSHYDLFTEIQLVKKKKKLKLDENVRIYLMIEIWLTRLDIISKYPFYHNSITP